MSTRIQIAIEELVLHGAAAGDRDGIAAGLRRELERLFSARALSESALAIRDVARIDAGSFSATPRAGGAAFGAQVARALFTSVTA